MSAHAPAIHVRSLSYGQPAVDVPISSKTLGVFVVAFFFIVLAAPAAGQALQGTVTDRNTGQPIAGATLLDGGCGQTATDANGNYSLTAQRLCNNGSGFFQIIATGYYK